jgi:uncharacterized protein YyaL (SSP411 family)
MGATLEALVRLQGAGTALLLVGPPDAALAEEARIAGLDVTAEVTNEQAAAFAEAGFSLFRDRVSRGGRAAAYLCEGFVCRLPVQDPADLRGVLAEAG